MIDKDKAIRKWSPVIENALNYKNTKINNIICVYCEWYSINEQNNDNKLPERLLEIKKKIHNFGKENKIEIIGEFLNPYSGLIEYKLADGRYINKGEKIEIDLTNKEIIELFGEDFLKYYSINDYRDIKLCKLGI